jgi:hypothetical protein
MKHYLSFDTTTGRITNAFTVAQAVPSVPGLVEVSEAQLAEVESGYIVDGTVTPRPTNPTTPSGLSVVADGTDLFTLSGLPNPSTVLVDGTPYEVTDGVFEVSFDLPGSYRVQVEAFPYLPVEYEVTAI